MNKQGENYHYTCLICKELADEDHKKGIVGNYLLSSMIWFNSEEESMNHLKRCHPKEFQQLNSSLLGTKVKQ